MFNFETFQISLLTYNFLMKLISLPKILVVTPLMLVRRICMYKRELSGFENTVAQQQRLSAQRVAARASCTRHTSLPAYRRVRKRVTRELFA